MNDNEKRLAEEYGADFVVDAYRVRWTLAEEQIATLTDERDAARAKHGTDVHNLMQRQLEVLHERDAIRAKTLTEVEETLRERGFASAAKVLADELCDPPVEAQEEGSGPCLPSLGEMCGNCHRCATSVAQEECWCGHSRSKHVTNFGAPPCSRCRCNGFDKRTPVEAQEVGE